MPRQPGPFPALPGCSLLHHNNRYACQENLAPGEACLVVGSSNGRQVVEVPQQAAATLDFVELVLEGTTDLTSGIWNLALMPAADQTGVAVNRRRWVPVGEPQRAFFRLRAVLK